MIGAVLCALRLHAWTRWYPYNVTGQQRRVCTRSRCRGRTVQYRPAP